MSASRNNAVFNRKVYGSAIIPPEQIKVDYLKVSEQAAEFENWNIIANGKVVKLGRLSMSRQIKNGDNA